jgi:hypothetical protein
MSWEAMFETWAGPLGETEQIKCDNAVRAVRKAIDASQPLQNRRITVFAQGSYRNRTNVRSESDVDICVLCDETFFFDLPKNGDSANFGLTTPATYTYSQFKNEVGSALNDYFGTYNVTRGNKAFDVHANTYRIDADVVPCFEYRRYWDDFTYRKGTGFGPDKGGRTINYPEQNYENGVKKNDTTGRRFKAIVRILKRLKYRMDEERIGAVALIPSFLIECLVWNVPDAGFGHVSYTPDVRWALAHLFNNTRKPEDCNEWCEINDYKYLFHSSQPWTFSQAHDFTSAAWDYLGFE